MHGPRSDGRRGSARFRAAGIGAIIGRPDAIRLPARGTHIHVVQIGPYTLHGRVLAAPMAGVSDAPFRALCLRLGAALAACEMTSSNPLLRDTAFSRRRLGRAASAALHVVQIAGADPAWLADAARHAVDAGAQIVDVNMGCPAKKVCNVYAGSALLRDERLVGQLLDRVVRAVDVPVTLKMRTGWSPDARNGVRVARIAAAAGIAAIAVHGRTRACGYGGAAEYGTIARIKAAVRVPVIANGDIDCPQRARAVLDATGADAVMIGRAAQRDPFIFRRVQHYLDTRELLPEPAPAERAAVLRELLPQLHAFYGERPGVRIARKHLRWQLGSRPGWDAFWARVNGVESAAVQRALLDDFLANGALAA